MSGVPEMDPDAMLRRQVSDLHRQLEAWQAASVELADAARGVIADWAIDIHTDRRDDDWRPTEARLARALYAFDKTRQVWA